MQVEPVRATDFSRPLARVMLTSAPAVVVEASRERVEELAATVLAAEAAGVTRWSLDTAVAYAKVREQFGKPIGSFQAVKQLCAEMLCRAEQAEVAAADAARAAVDSDQAQFSIAAALAASHRYRRREGKRQRLHSGARRHRVHLGARRAPVPAPGPQHRPVPRRRRHWFRRITALTQSGVRRRLGIDLTEVEGLRPEIAAAVAEVAALPEEKRQVALAEAGLQAPHWPAPYGRGASPAEQLLIDRRWRRPVWCGRTW